MKIKDITNFLIHQYPLNLQEKWDESGFLFKGNLNQNVNKCYVCLDLNNKTIDEAIKNKVNLIVSHHPIFTGVHNEEKPEIISVYKKLINKVKTHKITVLSLHTCFDNSKTGMNFLIAEKLKLKNIKWYKPQDENKFVVGNFSKTMTLKQIADLFRKTFGVSLLTTNTPESKKFNKLAICAGSGLSVFTPHFDSLAKQDYLLVTGDVKHHGWQDLHEFNLSLLDVGHDLENCFSAFIASLIKSEFNDIDVTAITTKKKEQTI